MKNIINYKDLEKQESLSVEKLFKLKPFDIKDLSPRPEENFIDLMNWTKNNFGHLIKSTGNQKKYVHNKIIMDGQFFQFCEENKVTLSCLLNDSIVSWKTTNGNEKFFSQGVFLVKKDKLEFLHAALYHKGNQNEDEISFFIVVDDSCYPEYIEFRNKYDEWILERDRSNLHIRVIESEDIPYTQNTNWDDIFLPTDLKNDIKLSVEGFLQSKEFYASKKLPWKRGIILHGIPGNGKTSIIRSIISNYNFKPVTVLPSANDDAIREAFNYAQTQSPSLLYFEDLDSLFQGVNLSSFLNLMDGISTKSGILVIATTNNIDLLQPSITDRPSRFDRKFHIPLPDKEMTSKFLKKWFDKSIPDKKIVELTDFSVKNSFSYVYLQELYISSMYNALGNNRKDLTQNDVDTALQQLLMDKLGSKNKTIGIDKYLKIKKV